MIERTPFASPGEARRLISATEGGWRTPGSIADALLMASELATNALTHSHDHIPSIRAIVSHTCLRVEIHDDDPTIPAPVADNDPSTPGGFGLNIVAALSTTWGVLSGPHGKAVWFEIDPFAEPDRVDRARRIGT